MVSSVDSRMQLPSVSEGLKNVSENIRKNLDEGGPDRSHRAEGGSGSDRPGGVTATGFNNRGASISANHSDEESGFPSGEEAPEAGTPEVGQIVEMVKTIIQEVLGKLLEGLRNGLGLEGPESGESAPGGPGEGEPGGPPEGGNDPQLQTVSHEGGAQGPDEGHNHGPDDGHNHGGGEGLIRPLNNYTVTSRYGSQEAFRSSAHTGVDLAIEGGTDIQAAGNGTVKVNGWDPDGYGNYVIIDHGDGTETLYGHMQSRSPLEVGQSVRQGQVIGDVGTTGNSTGNHLHFEVRKNGQTVNPEQYVTV